MHAATRVASGQGSARYATGPTPAEPEPSPPTRKLAPPADPDEVRDDVAALATWRPVLTDLDTLERGWVVQDRYGFSWWDSLIVAQALAAGCRTLLTEDLQHGQVVFGLRIVDPFQEAPEAPR